MSNVSNALFTGDLNTLTDMGIHYCGNSSTNLPQTGYSGMLIVANSDVGVVEQRLIRNKITCTVGLDVV